MAAWTVYTQTPNPDPFAPHPIEAYREFTTRAAAVAARVKAVADWRKSRSGRTAGRIFVPGSWPWHERDGIELKERGEVVGFINAFPSEDR